MRKNVSTCLYCHCLLSQLRSPSPPYPFTLRLVNSDPLMIGSCAFFVGEKGGDERGDKGRARLSTGGITFFVPAGRGGPSTGGGSTVVPVGRPKPSFGGVTTLDPVRRSGPSTRGVTTFSSNGESRAINKRCYDFFFQAVSTQWCVSTSVVFRTSVFLKADVHGGFQMVVAFCCLCV